MYYHQKEDEYQRANRLQVIREYFSFISSVSILDTHPADTHQSETTVQQQQPTAIKESEDDIEKKDTGRYAVNLRYKI